MAARTDKSPRTGPAGSESMRESCAKAPQCVRIIPTVVKEKRVHFHAALLHQLFAKGTNHGKRGRLIVGVVEADVVPGVVMQEGTIGTGPLPLDVVQETTPQLADGS